MSGPGTGRHSLVSMLAGRLPGLSLPTSAQPGNRIKARRLVALLLAFLALGLFDACGRKETPISPDLVLPAAVRNFRLSQEGESLVASWVFPQVNQLGQPLTQLAGFRLYRCAVPGVSPATGCAPDFTLLADIDLEYPTVGKIQGERVVYQDRNLTPGKCYSYRVAAYGPGGVLGAWSQTLSHAWGILPRSPASLTAEAKDREVQLNWPEVKALQDGTPVRDLAGYAVYRQTGHEAWQRLNPTPVSVNRYQDVAVKNEVEYTYMIRAVRRLGQYELASLDSPSRTVTPTDLTPPPPPLNLVAAPTSRGVELRWDPSPASDLAGYRVYRLRAGEARPVRLTTELLRTPHLLDTQVVPGQTYAYTVTAVDDSRRANESAPSEEAVITIR
jgi:fibronectin type 3 domain-containing protein